MYGKKEATMTKGLAITTMILLHLFCRKGADVLGSPLIWINKEVPLVYYIGFFAEICVPLYTICAGYAQQALTNRGGYKQQWKDNLKRIFRLMVNYWIVLILFCVLGLILPSDGSMPGSISHFLESIVLIHHYNGAWWFLNTYVILMLIPSVVVLFPVRKVNVWIGIIGCVCCSFIYYLIDRIGYLNLTYVDNAVVQFVWKEFINFIRVLPYFYIGAFLCKGKVVDEVKKYLDIIIPKSQNRILLIGIFLLFVGVSFVHKAALMLIVAIIVFFIFNLWQKSVNTERLFLFLGKHSTNIWLIHMFFYSRVFPGLVQRAKYPVLMFAFMMLLCCGTSEIICCIQNIVNKLCFGKREINSKNIKVKKFKHLTKRRDI